MATEIFNKEQKNNVVLQNVMKDAENIAQKLGSIQEALDFVKGRYDGTQLSEEQMASLQEYTGDFSNTDHMSLLQTGLKRKLMETYPHLADTVTDEKNFMDTAEELPPSFMDEENEKGTFLDE